VLWEEEEKKGREKGSRMKRMEEWMRMKDGG
jgi:hypothetical protein